MNKKLTGKCLPCLLLLIFSAQLHATGVLPESSVVVIEESDGEASMNVTNTDNSPVLLVTTLKDISQDNEKLLLVSPPAIRLDAGKTQKVRFVLRANKPLKTERLRRVIFNGVPPQKAGVNEVRMTVSQNLPVIIRPAGLARDNAPWKRLTWKSSANALLVSNPSPYVVRLAQSIQTLPHGVTLTLPQSYILPGEHLSVEAPKGKTLAGITHVRLSPATTWGYSVESYDSPVNP